MLMNVIVDVDELGNVILLFEVCSMDDVFELVNIVFIDLPWINQ